MGRIIEGQNFSAIASNSYVFVINKSNFEIKTFEVPSSTQCENGKNSDNEKEILLHIASSGDGRYIAGATDSKRLIIWDFLNEEITKEVTLNKRPMQLLITSKTSEAIVADKSGDVYVWNIVENKWMGQSSSEEVHPMIDKEPGPEPVLGHLSMLLDTALSEDERYIVTCDRDEKIRVSSYPNCYSIHSFCLGHTEFVSQIAVLPKSSKLLVSASGDGTLKLWNYLEGNCLTTLDVRLNLLDYSNSSLKSSILTTDLDKKLEPSNEMTDSDVTTHISKSENSESSDVNASPVVTKNVFVSLLKSFNISESRWIVGVSSYQLPVILFYEVTSDKFKFLTSICMESPPIDFIFLETSLLVFLESSSLVVVTLSDDLKSAKVVPEHPMTNIAEKQKLKALNTWTQLSGSLFKVRYDNFSAYKLKKEERIKNTNSKSCKRKTPD